LPHLQPQDPQVHALRGKGHGGVEQLLLMGLDLHSPHPLLTDPYITL
jgi:hypothetical protein